MLFDPQRDERFRNPDAQGAQAMDAGMTRRTKRNQQFRPVGTGRAVMDGEPLPRAAGSAAPAVAFEDLIAQPGKKPGRPPKPAITALAAARHLRGSLSARAEQRFLLSVAGKGVGSGQKEG